MSVVRHYLGKIEGRKYKVGKLLIKLGITNTVYLGKITSTVITSSNAKTIRNITRRSAGRILQLLSYTIQ